MNESPDQQPDLVVIGGSAGGVEALQALLAALPRDFSASLLVVLHIGARRSALPQVLAAAGPLPTGWAVEGEPIRPGHVHIAPPDHHMVVAPGCDRLHLSRGPAENRARPAVDPLFRSAALACGRRVVGVILSGALSDGTAGLAEIRRHGGTTVVQDPREARFPDMPHSALRYLTVEHCLPAADIAGLLGQLCGARRMGRLVSASGKPMPGRKEGMAMSGEHELKRPVTLTCPACGGAVEQSSVDRLPYFVCHTGHRFAAADMDEAQFRQVEQALEVALRVLNERAELCRRLGAAARGRSQPHSAGHWDHAMQEAEERAEVLRRFLVQSWERPLEDEGEGGLAKQPSPG